MNVQHNLPFVSIIIITLNRKKHLSNCLNSIYNLDYPKSKFEVVVIDGDSTDGTKEMLCSTFPKVKFVIEQRRGVAYARNTGWKNAKGELVVYIDDDCIVDALWLKRIVDSFDSPEIIGAGGPVLYLHPELIPPIFAGTPIGEFSLGKKKRLLKTGENLITANLAVRANVFRKIKFYESLVYNDSEDTEFCRSLLEADHKLLYVPDAPVIHNIDLRRMTVPNVIKRSFISGISFYLIEKRRKSPSAITIKFLRLFLGGLIDFFGKRRLVDLYWSCKCFIALLSSILLIPIWS